MKRPVLLLVPLLVGIVLFNAGFAVYLRPLLYTLTPLQRYYLDAYLASSWKARDPAAQTDIEWIWKTKPKGKMEFAREEDLVPRPASDLLWGGDPLPFVLSPQAAADGWMGISKSAPSHVNAAEVQPILQQAFFDGQPAWRFFVQPALMLLAALALWLLYRAREPVRLEQTWWKPASLSVGLGRKVLASGTGAAKGLQAPMAQLALPMPSPGPVILEQKAPQPKRKPAPRPAPVVLPTAPVQAARPAAPAVTPAKPKTTYWDESKGLD